MGVGKRDLGGTLLFAYRHAVFASGGKGAAFEGQQQVGRRALQGIELALLFESHAGYRIEQRPCIGMTGGMEYLVDCAALGDRAGIHDLDPVGKIGNDAEIVGDKYDRHAEAILEGGQKIHQLGLDRDHAINLGLPAVMTKDLADLIETGAMPAMNQYSGVQYTSVPELKEYIQKADLITLQIGANDALIRTIVALGEATNWKSEKLANSMVTGMFRNLTPDNIDYFMDCLKQLTLTPSEFRAVMYLLTTGMGQICTSTYADTVTQLERVMKDLRELNPEAQIMVLSYNNPVPLMPSWSRHFRRLNTAAAKLAAQYDVTYVPIPYTRTANDGHPTIEGHRYIGRQILKAVKH